MKILILDHEERSPAMEKLFRENLPNDNLDITRSSKYYPRHIPEGSDIYFLHTSYIEEDAIKELREKQPYSKIIILNSMLSNNLIKMNDSLRENIDSMCSGVLTIDQFNRILKKIDISPSSTKK